MKNELQKNAIFQYTDRLNAPLEVFILRECAAGGAVHPHWHYYLEMLYVLKGHILAKCNGVSYHLKPGDLILFAPQSVHSMHREPDSLDEDAYYFVAMADLNFLNIPDQYRTRFSQIFRVAFEKDPSHIHFKKTEIQDLPISQLLMESANEKKDSSYGYDAIICANLSKILTWLIRCLRRKGLDTDDIITTPDEVEASIASISQYIDKHCDQPLRVQDLATRCGMSYSYFARLFHDTYNQSCKEYIEFIRINKAVDLLLFTNKDLNYISQETGFADCSHLIRTFKKWKGTTPKQWRLEKKKR